MRSALVDTHWGIENKLHWVLDFGEDALVSARGIALKTFLMRRMAISLLNQETSTKRSLRQKLNGQLWTASMLQVLATTLSP